MVEEKKSTLTEKQKNLLDRVKNKAHLIGHLVGFKDLSELHAKWINKFWRAGWTPYVLQSHRASFKTSSIVSTGIIFKSFVISADNSSTSF